MNKVKWRYPPENLSLTENEVHIFQIQNSLYADNIQKLERFLSDNEKIKINRFIFEKDRIPRIISYAGLRNILSRYLSIAPQKIIFSFNEYGKPFIDDSINDSKVSFNISHSGDYILYAVSINKRTGIDIQEMEITDSYDSIIENYFSDREKRSFEMLSSKEKKTVFFNCWTRKEAFIKAVGLGLSYNLDSFSVPILPHEKLEIPGNSNSDSWSLLDIAIDDSYSASVAVEGTGLNFSYFICNPCYYK